jgi:hypothetical protein
VVAASGRRALVGSGNTGAYLNALGLLGDKARQRCRACKRRTTSAASHLAGTGADRRQRVLRQAPCRRVIETSQPQQAGWQPASVTLAG